MIAIYCYRFSEYKIISGKALSPDSTTLDLLEISKRNNSDYILQIKYRSDNNKVIGQLYNGKDGSSFWSITILNENNATFENFTDTITDKHERNKLLSRVLKSKSCRNILKKK